MLSRGIRGTDSHLGDDDTSISNFTLDTKSTVENRIDGHCFTISGSTRAIKDKFVFSSLLLSVHVTNVSHLLNRKRVSTLNDLYTYYPLSPSSLLFDFIAIDNSTITSLQDPGPCMTIRDTIPPVWTGCPLLITHNVSGGNQGANVSWTEPVASDNIGISSVGSNYLPSSFFSAKDSPHEGPFS
jgi:hypothetical protein